MLVVFLSYYKRKTYFIFSSQKRCFAYLLTGCPGWCEELRFWKIYTWTRISNAWGRTYCLFCNLINLTKCPKCMVFTGCLKSEDRRPGNPRKRRPPRNKDLEKQRPTRKRNSIREGQDRWHNASFGHVLWKQPNTFYGSRPDKSCQGVRLSKNEDVLGPKKPITTVGEISNE